MTWQRVKSIFMRSLPEPPLCEQAWLIDHDTTPAQWALLKKNAEIRRPKITEQGLIICTIAPRRTGKSYDDRQDILESLERKEHNAGNFNLRLWPSIFKKYWHPFEAVTEVAYQHRWRYHIDDAAVDLDCREWSQTPPKLRAWVNLLGHFESTLRLNFQVSDQVEKTFLDQCDEIYMVGRWWKLIYLNRWKRPGQTDPNMVPIWEGEDFIERLFNRRRWHWMNSEIWASFDTHDLSMLDSKYQRMNKVERQIALEETWSKRKSQIENYFDGQLNGLPGETLITL